MDPTKPTTPPTNTTTEVNKDISKINNLPKNKKIIGAIIIALIVLSIPATLFLISQSQDTRQRAASIPISKIVFSPGGFATKPGTYIAMSVLAYDSQGNPITNDVQYQWGMSSTGTVGSLISVSGNIATFEAKNLGHGDIYVTAANNEGGMTSSIPVDVTVNGLSPTPTNTPTPTNSPTPTPTDIPTPTPSLSPIPTNNPTPTQALPSMTIKPSKTLTPTKKLTPTPTRRVTPTPTPFATKCTAPKITFYSDTSRNGAGTVNMIWSPVTGAKTYTVQRQFFFGWQTISTTSSNSFKGSDGVGDANWRIFVSNGTCKPLPGPATYIDP